MPLLSTGLIIAGAYADKVRRTLFAQLKDKIKNNEITPQEVARAAGELNRIIYEALVYKLKIDKGDVVRIRINYEVEDGKIKWDYSSLTIEAFRREPDEKVEKIVKESIKEILEKEKEEIEKPVEEKKEEERKELEEEAKEELEEKEEKTEEKEAPPTASQPLSEWADNIAEAITLGELPYGGYVLALKDSNGDNLGLVVAEERAGTTVLDAIVISGDNAYRAYIKTETPLTRISEDPNIVLEELKRATPTVISKDEARKIIEERLKELT